MPARRDLQLLLGEGSGVVFGLDAVVIDDPVSHTPLVVPIGSHHRSGDPATAVDGITSIHPT